MAATKYRIQREVDSRELMRQNLKFLRECARRVLFRGESLQLMEDAKTDLMREFLAIGKSFRLSERDLVVLLFRGILS